MTPRIKLSQMVPKIVDKWSYELLHRAKMGETQAMMTVAQIQFSRHGWGRIRPDAVQARRWLEYGASRGDTTLHNSLQNLRTALAAREHDLKIARSHGLVDINKKGFNGAQIQPPSEQVRLPPINFNRIITSNPHNVVERTSEEEALQLLYKKEFKPIEETLREHKAKLLAEGKVVGEGKVSIPIDFAKLENERLNQQNEEARQYTAQLKKQLQEKVKTGSMSVEEAQKLIKKLDSGITLMNKKEKLRQAKNFETYHPPADSPQRR